MFWVETWRLLVFKCDTMLSQQSHREAKYQRKKTACFPKVPTLITDVRQYCLKRRQSCFQSGERCRISLLWLELWQLGLENILAWFLFFFFITILSSSGSSSSSSCSNWYPILETVPPTRRAVKLLVSHPQHHLSDHWYIYCHNVIKNILHITNTNTKYH